ncbi:MAG: antibiotic biosynthesis monooxygenase [Ruminococcaceae bacterium]|nr:antibiotic biosynthesis monooxygenase [Oscillospiraceae bacterium]
MSIALNLYYKGKNGSAKRFTEEIEKSGLADKIRNQPGNECYEYFTSMKDKETILLVDRWEDDDALHFHHDSSDMIKIGELKDKYDLELKVERYVTEKERCE